MFRWIYSTFKCVSLCFHSFGIIRTANWHSNAAFVLPFFLEEFCLFLFTLCLFLVCSEDSFCFFAFPQCDVTEGARNSLITYWWILLLIPISARKWNRFTLLYSAGMKACHDEVRLCHMTLFDVCRNSTHLLCSMLLLGFLRGLPAPVFLSDVMSMAGLKL